MTQLENFIAMYKNFWVDLIIEEVPIDDENSQHKDCIKITFWNWELYDAGNSISWYRWFYSEVYFTKDWNFIQQCLFE